MLLCDIESKALFVFRGLRSGYLCMAGPHAHTYPLVRIM